MANEVRLTLAGDSQQLERAFQRAAGSASECGQEMQRTARRFDDLAEAADRADTRAMGFRDGLTGIEDSMAAAGAIARGNLFEGLLLVGSGLSDLGSTGANFVMPMLKNLVTRFGAVRVAAFGVAGALAIAAGAIWYFAQRSEQADDAINELGDDIKKSALAGRLTDDIRRQLESVSEAQLKVAASSKMLAGLWKDVDRQLAEAIESGMTMAEVEQFLADTLGYSTAQQLLHSGALKQTIEAGKDAEFTNRFLAESIEATADEYRKASTEVTRFNDLLQSQTNPIFAFVNAQRRLRDAQRQEIEAIEQYGASSVQAEEAAWDRREAELALVDATARVATVNKDELLPTLDRLARDGQISVDTFEAIARAAGLAKDELSRLDGTRVSVQFEQVWRAQFGGGVVLPSGQRRNIGGAAFSVLHDGGIVPGPAGQEVAAILQAGERVIPLGGDPGQSLTLVLDSAGSDLDDLLVRIVARAVKAAGGNVQTAVGW